MRRCLLAVVFVSRPATGARVTNGLTTAQPGPRRSAQPTASNVDLASLGRFRTIGVVSNISEFREAFSCKTDAPMVRATPCRVW